MTRHHVASSSLRSVAYAEASRLLEIEFTTGAIYRYLDVPHQAYDALLAAASKGRHFNREIRDRFNYTRLTP